MGTYHVRQSRRHMNTTFALIVCDASDRVSAASIVLDEAHALIARLERELSEFIDGSPVSRLNQAAPGKRIEAPLSLLELLETSHQLREITEGTFDPTVKSVRRYAKTERAFCWDRETGMAWRNCAQAHLSFGAIGKGYALDRVRDILVREGFEDFCLSAGGSSLLFSGEAGDNEPWRWGWSWNRRENGEPLGIPFQHCSRRPIALGVSGIDEQGFHLLDPRTGRPAAETVSAVVGHIRATDADALSTALFVGGFDHGLRTMDKLMDPPALAVVEKDGLPRWNGLFQKLWGAPATLVLLAFVCASSLAEDAIDLSQLGVQDFTPYTFERNPLWILLPLLSLALVALHLYKPRRKRTRPVIREVE